MTFIGERLRVGSITEALGKLGQIRRGREVRRLGPVAAPGLPAEIVVTGSILTVQSIPTLAELNLLTKQDINFCLQSASRGNETVLNLIPGDEESAIIPEVGDKNILVLTFFNQEKYSNQSLAAVFSIISPDNAATWGARDCWHVLTPDFVFRMENLSNEEGMIDVSEEHGQYKLLTRVFRSTLPGPFERVFPYYGDEQYADPAGFYSHVVSAIAGNTFSTSFAISGLPRIFAPLARTRVFFLTWGDFEGLIQETHAGNFFRAFSSNHSWLRYFAR